MKKKALVVAAFLCIATITKSHAFGLGAQLNFGARGVFSPGASLLISPNDKTHLALNWFLDSDEDKTIGLTLDRVFMAPHLLNFKGGSLNATLGAGGYVNVVIKEDPDIEGGARLPVGLSLFLGPRTFEIFTHVAPSIGLTFLPKLDVSPLFFPMALGARFWFR